MLWEYGSFSVDVRSPYLDKKVSMWENQAHEQLNFKYDKLSVLLGTDRMDRQL